MLLFGLWPAFGLSIFCICIMLAASSAIDVGERFLSGGAPESSPQSSPKRCRILGKSTSDTPPPGQWTPATQHDEFAHFTEMKITADDCASLDTKVEENLQAAVEAEKAEKAKGGDEVAEHRKEFMDAATTGDFHAQGPVGQRWSKFLATGKVKKDYETQADPKLEKKHTRKRGRRKNMHVVWSRNRTMRASGKCRSRKECT